MRPILRLSPLIDLSASSSVTDPLSMPRLRAFAVGFGLRPGRIYQPKVTLGRWIQTSSTFSVLGHLTCVSEFLGRSFLFAAEFVLALRLSSRMLYSTSMYNFSVESSQPEHGVLHTFDKNAATGSYYLDIRPGGKICAPHVHPPKPGYYRLS